MKSIIILAASTLLLAAPALAGQTDCSSADQRVALQHAYSDGGAAMEPTAKVVLDGKVLYQSEPWGGTPVELATFAESDETQLSFTPMAGKDPQVRVYVEKLTLTDKSSGDVLFSDYVLCRDVARPCPLCP